MIFLERIKTSLSLAVMLKDNLHPEKKVIGDVFLKVPGIRKAVIKHTTGYFLLTNLSEGKYNITAGGKFYRQGNFTVDTGSIKPEQPFIDLFLKPKSNYPFPEGIIVLEGRIADTDDRPVPEASIDVKSMTQSAISDNDGDFLILFDSTYANTKIYLSIKSKNYKSKTVSVLLKKGTIFLNPIILIKK